MVDFCQRVRESCRRWVDSPQGGRPFVTVHVASDTSITQEDPTFPPFVKKILEEKRKETGEPAVVEWDSEGWHYQAPSDWPKEVRQERTALYILCLDAINFCFWPNPGYEYEHLAQSLSDVAQEDHPKYGDNKSITLKDSNDTYCLAPDRLEQLQEDQLRQWLEATIASDSPRLAPPNIADRCRLLREVGRVLNQEFAGSAMNLICRAEGSAVRLVGLLVQYFPGFRDYHDASLEYDGDQSDSQSQGKPVIYFLKRAQICVGDWYAALNLKDEDDNMYKHDLSKLTTFADYRVPQLLREEGLLEYSQDLATLVDGNVEIRRDSPEEWAIRAATVVAVERITALLQAMEPDEQSRNAWTDVRVDWYLW